MPNFEQIPINEVPENTDVEKKEDEINEEKVETELNQEPKNTEAEDQAINDLFAESKKGEVANEVAIEVGNADVKKKEEKTSSNKGRFSRTLKQTLAALTVMTAATNTPPAKSAEAEFTSGEKNKTEQLVSVEVQRQKMKIIEPYKVLNEEELKSLADSSGYVDLYDLVDLIQRRDPSVHKINFDERGNAGKIIAESDKHLIKDITHTFVLADDLVTYFAQRSKVQNDRGQIEIFTLSVNDGVEKVLLKDLKENTVKLVMATN